MTCGIYAIFSALDDDCLYVGQSQNVERRWREHVTKLKNRRKSALQTFVDWYHANGADESLLKFELVEICDNTDLAKNQAEGRWFDKLQPRFYGKVPSLSERWSHSEANRKAIADGLRNSKGCTCNTSDNCVRHPLVNCGHCGKAFNDSRWDRPKKYCSRACSDYVKVNRLKELLPKDVLEQLYVVEKRTAQEIGGMFSCSGASVGNALRQHGIPVQWNRRR